MFPEILLKILFKEYSQEEWFKLRILIQTILLNIRDYITNVNSHMDQRSLFYMVLDSPDHILLQICVHLGFLG